MRLKLPRPQSAVVILCAKMIKTRLGRLLCVLQIRWQGARRRTQKPRGRGGQERGVGEEARVRSHADGYNEGVGAVLG